MIKVLFDDRQYLDFNFGQFDHNIDSNLAFKNCILRAVVSEPFKDLITYINSKNFVLTKVFVDDKLFLEAFVNDDNFTYADTPSETTIQLTLSDRFIGIKESDLITTKPQGTLINYLANILKELNYAGKNFINTYNKKIKTTRDLIAIGNNIDTTKQLKTFVKTDLEQYSAEKTIGDICGLVNVVLISNGYDELKFEKISEKTTPVYEIISPGKNLICHFEKVGKTSLGQSLTPSKVIILNSNDEGDQNTSVVKYNNSGIPHIQKINHVNLKASYADISKYVDYSFAGIKARNNSFILKVSNLIFDDNGNFFIPNTCVKVRNEKWGIDEIMRIMQVGFTIDAEGGTELTLNVTTQDSFENNVSLKQKRSLMNR